MASLSKGSQDNEIHITYEDQQQINTFARNNARLSDLKEEIEAKKKELENITDAVDEIMMLEGDDEAVPFQIGEVFFSTSSEKATELLEKKQKEIEEVVDKLNHDAADFKTLLQDLKVKLYAKFGDNIHLENDESV